VIVDSKPTMFGLTLVAGVYYRKDPPNTEVFLKLPTRLYEDIRNGVRMNNHEPARLIEDGRDINILEYALKEIGRLRSVQVLEG